MKRFVLALIAFFAISATAVVQAQTTYRGTLSVTASNGVTSTDENSQVTVDDHGTTATLTMYNLNIGGYTVSTVTATLEKTTNGIVTGCSNITVTGTLPNTVTPSSASGLITADTCSVDISMKALLGFVTVDVSFRSNNGNTR
jgi:hypothetical protein